MLKLKSSLLVECLRISCKHLPKHPEFNAYKHYSFVIQNNSIIEWGTNRAAPSIIGYQPWQKLHSENQAYFRAQGLLNKNKRFDIVNIRLNKSGDILLSHPCKCCISFLKHLGCNYVWFTTALGFARLKIN